jgi:hypothetical protein
MYAPRRNWDSPNPFSRQRVFPSPQKQRGGGTLACGWGVGGSPNSDEGHTPTACVNIKKQILEVDEKPVTSSS